MNRPGASRPAAPGRRTRNRRRNGQSLTEFALILPVMLLLLLAAIDFGRLFFSYVQITNAAREAAAYAAPDPAVSQASIDSRAAQEANAQSQRGEGAVSVSAPVCTTATTPPTTVSCATAAANNGGSGNQVSVVVSRPFTFLSPVIGGIFGTLTLSSSATSPVYNAPAPTPPPPPPPDPCTLTADFIFDQSKWNKPVDFTDQSTPVPPAACAVTGWLWDFGQPSSGAANTSTLKNPSHDYNVKNTTFTVTLTVTRTGGTATFSQPVLTLDK